LIINDGFLASASSLCVSKDGVWLGIGHFEGSIALYLLTWYGGDLMGATFVERFDTNGTVTLSAISSQHFYFWQ
jgi:hypothetical protein